MVTKTHEQTETKTLSPICRLLAEGDVDVRMSTTFQDTNQVKKIIKTVTFTNFFILLIRVLLVVASEQKTVAGSTPGVLRFPPTAQNSHVR